MDNLIETRIGRFDQVRIITTKNVSYVSAPPGTNISPKGLWSVISIVAVNELLLAQKSVLIRVPATDVLLVAGYDVRKITQNLGKLSHGESKKRHSNSENSAATDRPN